MASFAAQRVVEELENHVRRVIEHPQPGSLNVADMRGPLAEALDRLVMSKVDDIMNEVIKKARLAGVNI